MNLIFTAEICQNISMSRLQLEVFSIWKLLAGKPIRVLPRSIGFYQR